MRPEADKIMNVPVIFSINRNKVVVKRNFFFSSSYSGICVYHLIIPLSSPKRKIAHIICHKVSILPIIPYSATEKLTE